MTVLAVVAVAALVLVIALLLVLMTRADPRDAVIRALQDELCSARDEHRIEARSHRDTILETSRLLEAARDERDDEIVELLASSRSDLRTIIEANERERADLLRALMSATSHAQDYGALGIAERKNPDLQAAVAAAARGMAVPGVTEPVDDEGPSDDVLRPWMARRTGGAGQPDVLRDADGEAIIPVGMDG